jgi:pimeloyl-ACP methyl ester carboxylesterase
MKLAMKMILLPLIILGLAVVLLNAYSIYAMEARLTPMDTRFDSSLPGKTITENGLNADFFCGTTDVPRKVVIILGGSEGGKHWNTNTAYIQRLLDHGYCVMVLAYFHAPGLPPHLREIPLEYFEKVFDWFPLQDQIIPDDYAIIGHSRGGELALLLASQYPQIKTVIALAPSSVVFPGSPTSFFDVLIGQHSAWSYRGQPLPFVPWALSPENAPGLFTGRQARMFEQALQNKEAVSRATIPIEHARGAVLCFSANGDTIWPSTRMCDQIIAWLAENHFAFEYEHLSHDFDHGWCGLESCWNEIVVFLNTHFK